MTNPQWLELTMVPKLFETLKFDYIYCFFGSDLPPSQGGRYSGFGNTVVEPKKEDAIFESTLSTLASVGNICTLVCMDVRKRTIGCVPSKDSDQPVY